MPGKQKAGQTLSHQMRYQYYSKSFSPIYMFFLHIHSHPNLLCDVLKKSHSSCDSDAWYIRGQRHIHKDDGCNTGALRDLFLLEQ